jgi:uncharacterized protein (TIGR02646 family)
MIHVERSRVELDEELESFFENEKKRAKAFFNRKTRTQERFKFNPNVWKDARAKLNELFDNTCAYCESPLIGSNAGNVEQFRPRIEACDLNNQADSDWYWWLAYEWENLYLVCKKCCQNKKNYFPVVGTRAKIGAKGKSLRLEKNLLLDPCVDEPANHLHFLEDGTVESVSSINSAALENFAGNDRGAVTIKVLALNRTDLVESRLFYARKVIDVLEKIAAKSSADKPLHINELIDDLLGFVNEFDSFVAVKRQVIARRLTADETLMKFIERVAATKLRELKKLIAAELALQNRLQQRTRGARLAEVAEPPTPVVTPLVEVNYENAYIRRVKIHNFRSLQNFDIRINERNESKEIADELRSPAESENSAEKGVGWKMLLGENGTGKSSVLKAVALALGGEEHFREKASELMLEPKQIFNKKTREKSGYIQIELSKGELIHITFDRTNLTFETGGTGGANVYVRGYGSARLFSRDPRRADRASADEPLKDTANLFHPEILLADPNRWLAQLNQSDFDSTALSLRDLLNLPDDIKKPLTKKGKEVFLDSGHGSLPLADQSDGYNSILALLVDILAGLPKTIHDKREATGIVLLDEIDSHLHPRWKMRIVGSLRKTFPNVQFIATTHEPLCLRGLEAGEIAVMKRESGKIIVQDEVPSTVGYRVDQLLTSELFGLESTIDPSIEEKFYNYYRLLAEPEPADEQTAQERNALVAKLKQELQGYNVLGFTRRDQLVYEIIDEYLSKEKDVDKPQRDKLKAGTKRKVFELWNMVDARQEKMR